MKACAEQTRIARALYRRGSFVLNSPQDGTLWIVQKAIDYIIGAKLGGAK